MPPANCGYNLPRMGWGNYDIGPVSALEFSGCHPHRFRASVRVKAMRTFRAKARQAFSNRT